MHFVKGLTDYIKYILNTHLQYLNLFMVCSNKPTRSTPPTSNIWGEWLFTEESLLLCTPSQYTPKKSIPYRMLYRFGHQYNIFRIPINTGIPFRVYCYFIYLIYVYIHTHPHKHIHTDKSTQRYTNTPTQLILKIN